MMVPLNTRFKECKNVELEKQTRLSRSWFRRVRLWQRC